MANLLTLSRDQIAGHEAELRRLRRTSRLGRYESLRSLILEMIARIEDEPADHLVGDIEPLVVPAGMLAMSLGFPHPVSVVRYSNPPTPKARGDWLTVDPLSPCTLREAQDDILMALGFRFNDPLVGGSPREVLWSALACRGPKEGREYYPQWRGKSVAPDRLKAVSVLRRWTRAIQEAAEKLGHRSTHEQARPFTRGSSHANGTPFENGGLDDRSGVQAAKPVPNDLIPQA